jgi:hypothetical protein
MKKCKDNQERRFYILATKKFGWSKNVLIHQIENKTYEKYLLGQTNFDTTLPDIIKKQAVLASRTIVEYSLKTSSMPIGVSTYTTSEKLPSDYKRLLPDSKTISRNIDQLFEGDNNL